MRACGNEAIIVRLYTYNDDSRIFLPHMLMAAVITRSIAPFKTGYRMLNDAYVVPKKQQYVAAGTKTGAAHLIEPYMPCIRKHKVSNRLASLLWHKQTNDCRLIIDHI